MFHQYLLIYQVDLEIYTPVCLAQTTDTDTFYGKSAWVYGWGTVASGGSASATLLEVTQKRRGER